MWELKLGANIAALRKAKGMTQEQLAALGISSPAVSKWETNSSYPDITLLCPLARALDTNVDMLLNYEKILSSDVIEQKMNEILSVARAGRYQEAGNTLACYAFLPISGQRLFLWKTIQGFLWGEITLFLFWSILICLERLPVLSAFLLLLYGTSMNYVCSWLGVLIDLKMPRTVNSTNELLHGNISKVLVLITATILTVGEIFLSSRKWLPVPLLPFACLAGAGVAAGEICFWRFCKGVFYDTDS